MIQKTRKNNKNQLFLYGCRGYSYNIFTENIEDRESKEHIIKHLIKSKQPNNDEGKIKCLRYNIIYKKLKNENDLISSKPLLIQIFKSGYNIPRLSFIFKNNYILVNWSKDKCKLKKRFATIKENHKINTKKIKITSTELCAKLNELKENPTYELLHELFGFNKSYLTNQNLIENILNEYKNTNIYVYSI